MFFCKGQKVFVLDVVRRLLGKGQNNMLMSPAEVTTEMITLILD